MFLKLLIAQATPPNLPDIEEIDIPEPLPDPWKNIIWIVVGVIALLIIATVIFIAVRALLREKKRTLTAEYIALKQLSALESNADELTPNEFSQQVSDSLKDFVQSRFDDPLRYETAEEFLGRIAQSETTAINPQVRDQLGEFLSLAEEIKFGLPPDAEAQKTPLLQKATTIIDTQRQVMRDAAAANRKR